MQDKLTSPSGRSRRFSVFMDRSGVRALLTLQSHGSQSAVMLWGELIHRATRLGRLEIDRSSIKDDGAIEELAKAGLIAFSEPSGSILLQQVSAA